MSDASLRLRLGRLVVEGSEEVAVIGVSVGCCTDVGVVRTLNEDQFYTGDFVWAVADGMGGHAAGEVASEIVVTTLGSIDHNGLEQRHILSALSEANDRVLEYGRQNPASRGLGSTVTGLARVDIGGAEHWAVFNVGDSRVYRIVSGVLARATLDHSEVEELVLQGAITDEEARHHASRSYITRSIGTEPPPQVDLWVLPQTPGERFMLCSDGLSSELSDPAIGDILERCVDPDVAAEELVSAAVAAGGRDNITVIVVDVEAREDEIDVTESTTPRPEFSAEGVGR